MLLLKFLKISIHRLENIIEVLGYIEQKDKNGGKSLKLSLKNNLRGPKIVLIKNLRKRLKNKRECLRIGFHLA